MKNIKIDLTCECGGKMVMDYGVNLNGLIISTCKIRKAFNKETKFIGFTKNVKCLNCGNKKMIYFGSELIEESKNN